MKKGVSGMAFFGRMKHYYADCVDELLVKVGHLRPYLRVYDDKESILFSSRSRGESKVLSNFHASSVPLPWRGKLFTSVEAMIFYTYIEENCNNPKWETKKQEVLEMILNTRHGREVKEINRQTQLYKKVRKATVEVIGEENWDLYAWKVACDAVRVKYEHCPEFRKFVDENRDKSFVENSYWSKIPKAGVLKVTDEQSPYFGKYIGCNFTGVAIQRCLQEG